mmetsp:Transcript_41035/g.88738  ORF Transcript_41035/g.88738 Transcript_41035/m.88738 type:complete len:109 (+) Transcript_41035:380-706(+)
MISAPSWVPHFGDSPQPNITNEGDNRKDIYTYSEFVGHKTSNQVVHLINFYRRQIFKSKTIVAYFCAVVELGIKFSPDRLFGTIGKSLGSADLFNMPMNPSLTLKKTS